MTLLAFWSFLSPGLLWWGAAAAVPILIHLWSRRRYRETPWAATQFLLAALRKHQRRLRIEEWLLLAARTFVLLCLALALAEPIISGASLGGAWPTNPPRHTVLVLDASYSMARQQGGQSRFERAQQLAAELVRTSAPGDKFTLVLLADPPSIIIADPSADQSSVLHEIRDLKISHGGANLVATLSEVAQIVAKAGRPPSSAVQQRVQIFSDLGRTTWAAATSLDGRRLLDALDSQAELHLTDVGDANTSNLALTSLSVGSRVVVTGQSIELTVGVENYGPERQTHKRIELLADDISVGEQYVDLVAGGRASITFTHRFEIPGEHVVEARLGEDALELDNHRWLALPVRDAIRVLCVEGSPHAADYIALALAPEADARSMIVPQVAAEHALLETDLANYDSVFLCNLARIGPAEARVLHEYVQRGGGLIIVLGDLVQAASYNEQLGVAAESKLLPGRLTDVVADGLHHLDPREYQHPLVAPFRGHERAGLLTVPVWRYVRLTDVDKTSRVPLTFGNGDPAVVEAAVGQGRVLLVATALSPESVDRRDNVEQPWTAITAWPSFPPLVHEMLNLASSGRWQRRNGLVGEPLNSQVPEGIDVASARLTTPADGDARLGVDLGNRRWNFADTLHCGIYRARYGAAESAQEVFAVNLETRESDLTRQDLDTLGEYFRRGGADDHLAPAQQAETPLFRLLLGGVIVFLITDSWLAWRFGRENR